MTSTSTTTRRTRRTPRNSNHSREVVSVALGTLKHNGRLNLAGRVLLMIFALGTATAATVLVVLRAEETVGALTDPTRSDEIGKLLLALTAPVLLLLLLGGLAVLVGFLAHSRGLDESVKTLDSVNRLRREDEVAVSARGLIVAFEEQLSSIKRAHSIVMWVARSLFIVTIGLFLVCVVTTLAQGADPATLVLGAASLAGALLGTAKDVPGTIAHHSADVLQMQLIVTGAHRQISMLESDAIASLNNKKTKREDAHKMVLEAQQRIEDVLAMAVVQVEHFADPGDPDKKSEDEPASEPQADVVPLPTAA
jgi:hypothetical protein